MKSVWLICELFTLTALFHFSFDRPISQQHPPAAVSKPYTPGAENQHETDHLFIICCIIFYVGLLTIEATMHRQ